MGLITKDAHKRCAEHTLLEQLTQWRQSLPIDEQIKIVDKLLQDRRKRQVGIAIERRDPTRRGLECVDNDTDTDSI